MTGPWPAVPLGEVLSRSDETITLSPDAEYREITVKLWGKGAVLRGVVLGAQIGARRRYVARADQFILSRIDARNGALDIVPTELDGAIVSNDFPVFRVDADRILPSFLGWMCRTATFVETCKKASEGTTNRVRLQEARFLEIEIPLPPLTEQRRVVARVEGVATQTEEVRQLREVEAHDMQHLLLAAFIRITNNATRRPMHEVAPLVRRPVAVDASESYPELGIRSFGKGTFHKPAVSGLDIGTKRIFQIFPGDLLFSNVFAWEGAIAVARPEDAGRVGSQRFITCVPTIGVATARFLCFYFLTDEGLELIRAASPGGAGRNRTLGLTSLGGIPVPVPSINDQNWFDSLQGEVATLKRLQQQTSAELDALMPAILNRAFRGEL